MESSTGEDAFAVTWNIVNNLQTVSKILSLKKMLDYDLGEQFKTLFNTMIPNADLYIVSVDEGSLSDIAQQPGAVGQLSGLDESDEVLGYGPLYGTADDGNKYLFCNNVVRRLSYISCCSRRSCCR